MSDNVKVIGIVRAIGETQTFASGSSKCTFRIETEEQYPQTHDIEAYKDKVDIVKNLEIGQKVIAICNLRGNYWAKGDKAFTTLSLWMLKAEDTEQMDSHSNGGKPSVIQDSEDDVPF